MSDLIMRLSKKETVELMHNSNHYMNLTHRGCLSKEVEKKLMCLIGWAHHHKLDINKDKIMLDELRKRLGKPAHRERFETFTYVWGFNLNGKRFNFMHSTKGIGSHIEVAMNVKDVSDIISKMYDLLVGGQKAEYCTGCDTVH